MIQLLDCTLRDGAHVNEGCFGNGNIKRIAENLAVGGLDYIELGFLKNVEYNPNITSYPTIENAYEILTETCISSGAEYALMARADEYDVAELTECNGKIKLIRIAFYYDYLKEAAEFTEAVKSRGYDVTFNLINTPGASFEELQRVIEYANKLKVKILTIVDTFGILQAEELGAIIKKYDDELDSDIMLGLHAHENLALAYSLAQYFIGAAGSKRDIIIDGSLMGMGRIPGNLCIELIADYMNAKIGKQYDLTPLLELIGDIIAPIKQNIPWGYSTAYFLSAKYRVHRTYAEYLSKQGLTLAEMDSVLKEINRERALKFDKDYIDAQIVKYCRAKKEEKTL